METKRIETKNVKLVVKLLKEGKVIAFPTDTVYGLAVIYENEKALEALKKSKGRPDEKPIPTMVSSVEQIKRIAHIDDDAQRLVEAFMPGAFTMILKKKESLPSYLTNGFNTVGVRMPDDTFVLDVIEQCGKPLLVTSANVSGEETGIYAEQVLAQLDGRIDAIVMGEAAGKVASTIVDVSCDVINILREGPIRKSMIERVLNEVK